jgi:hypothetical protein
MPDITNQTVFAPLEAFIRTEEYSDADLLNLIGNWAGRNATVAQAMAFHARDTIHEHRTEDLPYVDVVVQVYYRTFFSPEHAGLYGTDFMVHDDAKLKTLVDYIIDPTSEVPANVAEAPYTPTAH